MLTGVAAAVVFVAVMVVDYRMSPACRWCQSRHFGRCTYNPRSGRVWANDHDGHFDYYDPNK